MRRDADGDQEIAGTVAGRGLALPLQPDLLTRCDTGGNLDIEFLAGRQPDPLFHALDRLFQRHRHGDTEIEVECYAAGIELEGIACTAGTRAARRGRPQHAVELNLETAAPSTPGTGSA